MNQVLSRVIAATDFSEPAEHAAIRAAQLAQQQGVRLHLRHSLEEGDWLQRLIDGSQGAFSRELWRRAAEVALAQACDRAQRAGQVAVDVQVADGPLGVELDRLADGDARSLVVVGAHGGHGVREALLGSTADRLLRSGRMPVLLVRNLPGNGYRRVALATDFSSVSRQAALLGLALAPGADHFLFHAIQLPPDRDLAFASRSAETLALFRDEARAYAAQGLAGFADGLGPAAAGIVRAPREGPPARALAAFVREAQLDLVVIGTRPRARWEANLLGSTALFAVTSLPCDVLLVPGVG